MAGTEMERGRGRESIASCVIQVDESMPQSTPDPIARAKTKRPREGVSPAGRGEAEERMDEAESGTPMVFVRLASLGGRLYCISDADGFD
jgi:hypothetical protein